MTVSASRDDLKCPGKKIITEEEVRYGLLKDKTGAELELERVETKLPLVTLNAFSRFFRRLSAKA